MICPAHNKHMVRSHTRYGDRFDCPEPDCTVVCWGGSTSTPADAETRALRHECHEAFDPLWKKKIRFEHRGQAYGWLRNFMGTSKRTTHIGMFDAEQCRKLLDFLKEQP